MTDQNQIRKIFEGVVTRQQMYCLFNRHAKRPIRGPEDAVLYAGEWFEISQVEHDHMFEILPPLWMRGSVFAMRAFMTGSVTSVFFSLWIDSVTRYFHGYCDLSDPMTVDAMRIAIIERESRPVRAMTRQERLEHIWSSTAEAYRGYAGDRWPPAVRGHRTITLWRRGFGTALQLLEALTDDEIAAKLPVQVRHLPDATAA